MDFAENYSCKSVEEIQTAYWNQTGVTLHPVVVYYKKNGETQHKMTNFFSLLYNFDLLPLRKFNKRWQFVLQIF
jgi:hypothetical protein